MNDLLVLKDKIEHGDRLILNEKILLNDLNTDINLVSYLLDLKDKIDPIDR